MRKGERETYRGPFNRFAFLLKVKSIPEDRCEPPLIREMLLTHCLLLHRDRKLAELVREISRQDVANYNRRMGKAVDGL